MADRVNFVCFEGPCWHAVPRGERASVLSGTVRAGRYNRPGVRTLYMSGSPAGVAAAMTRYGERPRDLLRLEVRATALLDLRDRAACATLAIPADDAGQDWLAAVEVGASPASWSIADTARAAGAAGLIEASRRAPAEWHLVLFRWNQPGAAAVVAGP